MANTRVSQMKVGLDVVVKCQPLCLAQTHNTFWPHENDIFWPHENEALFPLSACFMTLPLVEFYLIILCYFLIQGMQFLFFFFGEKNG